MAKASRIIKGNTIEIVNKRMSISPGSILDAGPSGSGEGSLSVYTGPPSLSDVRNIVPLEVDIALRHRRELTDKELEVRGFKIGSHKLKTGEVYVVIDHAGKEYHTGVYGGILVLIAQIESSGGEVHKITTGKQRTPIGWGGKL